MTETTAVSGGSRLRDHAERNLGALVIAVEFTLISVMVGVILFPLMDYATLLLRDLRFEYWPYILSGLLFILYLWTEVISHSLSFIGWRINIGHNLLYIVFTMILAIQMHFLSDPRGWFAMNIATAITAYAIMVYDLRGVEQRMARAAGSALILFQSARERQAWLVRVSPLNIAIAMIQIGLLLVFPSVFVDRPGHIVLVTIQIVGLLYFTSRTIRNFEAGSELILSKTVDELASEAQR